MQRANNKVKNLSLQLIVGLVLISFSVIGFAQSIGSALQPEFLIDQQLNQPKTSKAKELISISDQLKFKPGTQLDQDNYSAQAEFWTEKNWGITGSVEVNDLKIINMPKNISTRQLSLKKKLFSSNESNSYLAFGLGWRDIKLDETIDSEGINVSLLGNYSFSNSFLVYGKGSLFEGLKNDFAVSGYLFETGVKFNTNKRFSFSAGLKVLDFENQGTNIRNTSSSFLLGTHLSF